MTTNIDRPIINQDAFLTMLREKLTAGMMQAAEPVIQKALAEAEKAMRERLGSMVIGLLEHSYDVMRDGSDLRILVRHQWPNSR
jgi:hypothetical protein